MERKITVLRADSESKMSIDEIFSYVYKGRKNFYTSQIIRRFRQGYNLIELSKGKVFNDYVTYGVTFLKLTPVGNNVFTIKKNFEDAGAFTSDTLSDADDQKTRTAAWKYIDSLDERAELVSIKINYSELINHGGKTMNTWKSFQSLLGRVLAKHREGGDLGYAKVDTTITWENGITATIRIDVGMNPGDFSPDRESIGDHLYNMKQLMGTTNMEFGGREFLMFEDKRNY